MKVGRHYHRNLPIKTCSQSLVERCCWMRKFLEKPDVLSLRRCRYLAQLCVVPAQRPYGTFVVCVLLSLVHTPCNLNKNTFLICLAIDVPGGMSLTAVFPRKRGNGSFTYWCVQPGPCDYVFNSNILPHGHVFWGRHLEKKWYQNVSFLTQVVEKLFVEFVDELVGFVNVKLEGNWHSLWIRSVCLKLMTECNDSVAGMIKRIVFVSLWFPYIVLRQCTRTRRWWN